MDIVSILRGILGICVILGIAFLMSDNKKNINWKLVGAGFLIQIFLAVFVIKGDQMGAVFAPLGWIKGFFSFVSSFFVVLLDFTEAGAKFIFGSLAMGPGSEGSLGVFFAFQVLPTIIFFASLMSLLYYLGIMQHIVQAMAWLFAKIMGTSGAESLSCTANIFVGQTEAPLMIKPFIKNMTQSELLTVMVGGMATIAGGVMAAYIKILGTAFAEIKKIPVDSAELLFATQLLGASVIAAPGAMLISKIIKPEIEEPVTKGTVKIDIEKNASNAIEAAATGASDGLTLALNVAAMLLAFIALVAMFNFLLFNLGEWTGLNALLMQNFNQPLNFQLIVGMIMQGIGLAIGIPWNDGLNFGSLFGTKLILNEFVAYLDFATLIKNGSIYSEKTIFMATYALCGFANISSIAIQIGGIGPLAPERKGELAKLGIKAVIGGSLATLLSAAIAGILF